MKECKRLNNVGNITLRMNRTENERGSIRVGESIGRDTHAYF